MPQFYDQLNRSLHFRKAPKRIVSLVPSQSELLIDLGLIDKLLGITKFCVHPPDLRSQKKVVGGTKTAQFEKIKSLQPDIILCNKEENTLEMVQELEKIAPVHVSDVRTMENAIEMILQYGQIFEVTEKAQALVTKIKVCRDDFLKMIEDRPKKRVAYLIWRKPWMAAGKDTFIDHLLSLNKFENIFTKEDSRYPEIELKELDFRKPDIIFLSSEPFPFKEKHKLELKQEITARDVRLVDGESFSWYGSRLVAAFDYFKKLSSSPEAF